jgi:hypothetical protein
MMSRDAWISRLSRQLPGWYVWWQGPAREGWYAVPAPVGAVRSETLSLPNRIGPYRTPQELRSDAQERYGWNDHCETCGVLARECGHRRPERRDR